MKKTIKFAILVLVLSSCSGKDEQFCACIKISDALNQKSNQILTDGPNQQLANELSKLKKSKADQCKDYQNMGGEEMLAKKKHCQ